MSTQPITQQVRWQDLKVRNEIDVVLEIAKKEGWEDCEIFGHGDMITQPQESKGWKLIPADLYKYSIPREGVGRLHQIINAGVRIQGVIIADDERRTEPPLTPAKPEVLRPSIEKIVSFIGKALLGLIFVAGTMALITFLTLSLIYLAPILILGSLAGAGVGYDPKLVILVDDGKGGTVWISLFTWYD
ncbi:MAG: hypothetical protein ABSB41_15740 [Anaerolineales bacterium]|jgi:hypothetical protein